MDVIDPNGYGNKALNNIPYPYLFSNLDFDKDNNPVKLNIDVLNGHAYKVNLFAITWHKLIRDDPQDIEILYKKSIGVIFNHTAVNLNFTPPKDATVLYFIRYSDYLMDGKRFYTFLSHPNKFGKSAVSMEETDGWFDHVLLATDKKDTAQYINDLFGKIHDHEVTSLMNDVDPGSHGYGELKL